MAAACSRWSVVVAGLAWCLAGVAMPAAVPAQEHLVARPSDQQGGNSDRIIDAVQKRYHARVVRVADTQVNGRAALELRLLSDQRVWTIVVDAKSGQVLSGG